MKKFFSAVLKIVLIIVVVLVLATILLAIFFPQEKLRVIAQEQLTKKLSREVTIGKIGINIFQGIVIRDVKVSERHTFQQGTFVSCKAFIVKYDLLQLLHRRFLLEALVLDTPEITVKRYKADGKVLFNFSDLIPEKKQTAAPPVPEKKKVAVKPVQKKPVSGSGQIIPKISKGQIPVNVEIHELGLKDAKIEVIDTATERFKENYSLNKVHFLLSGIDLDKNSMMKISTGFGVAVTEYKDGVKNTDKAINCDTEISGGFVLFDKAGLLNPEGVLKLQLANGKFKGLQLYQQLNQQGKELSESGKKYQTEILSKYKDTKKAIDDAKKNKDAAKYAGNLGGTMDKVDAISAKLDKMDMGFLQKGLDLGFLKDSLEFDSLWTVLIIRDQKVISSNIEMNGAEVRAQARGWTGFNQMIEYYGTLFGNKKYNDNLLTKSLANDKGEIVLPLLITGTLSKPQVKITGIDVKAIIYKEMQSRLGPDANVLMSGGVSGAVDNLKNQANAKLEAEKQKALQEAQAKLDAEKKKQEEDAKKKLQEEAQKKLNNSGVNIPKF
jgi:hypothetical protein